MATALYNKYRPQVFEDVVGQEHIARTLKNAIASNKTSHSYLFTGPRGTGKTTTARLFSKALLCEKGPTPDPDGTCEDCELIARGEHPDVYELDAASRTGVENVREEIIGKVHYAPTRGRYKIYIIDEVHMLSTAAFNALLKTLEEPPDHVVFVLCTTDPQNIPETILSRCQRFDFRRISSEEMISRLGAICEMENVEFEGDALDLIAHRAQGGMRDALTSLEQLIAFGDGSITMELAERLLGSIDSSEMAQIVDAIGKRDVARCFKWTAEYMETGADLVQFVQDLTAHMRDMYVMSFSGVDVLLEITEAARRELEAELSMFGSDRLARILNVLGSLSMELKTSTNQRLSFEVALTRLVRPESDITLDALAERIESLERALSSEVANQGHTTRKVLEDRASFDIKDDEVEPKDLSKQGLPKKDLPRQDLPKQDLLRQHDAGLDAVATTTTQSNTATSVGEVSVFWDNVLKNLDAINPAYSVIYADTNAVLDGEVLRIEFDPKKDFAFQASQKAEARSALERALAKAGSPGMRFMIVKGDQGSGVVSQGASSCSAFESRNSTDNVVSSSNECVDAKIGDAIENNVVFEPNERSVQQSYSAQAEKVIEDSALHGFRDDNEASHASHDFKNDNEGANTAASVEDADFADFLTSAFGENVIIEEIDE